MWLKLTDIEGSVIFVNMNLAESFSKSGTGGTSIVYPTNDVSSVNRSIVRESVESIAAAVEAVYPQRKQ